MMELTTDLKPDDDIYDCDSRGNYLFHYLVLDNNLPMIKQILTRTGCLYQQNYHGNTPFMLAAMKGSFSAIQLFEDFAIDWNFKNKDGRTALFYAAARSDKNIFEFLIRHGASFSVLDNFNRNPLSYCPNEKARYELKEIAQVAMRKIKIEDIDNYFGLKLKNPTDDNSITIGYGTDRILNIEDLTEFVAKEEVIPENLFGYSYYVGNFNNLEVLSKRFKFTTTDEKRFIYASIVKALPALRTLNHNSILPLVYLHEKNDYIYLSTHLPGRTPSIYEVIKGLSENLQLVDLTRSTKVNLIRETLQGLSYLESESCKFKKNEKSRILLLLTPKNIMIHRMYTAKIVLIDLLCTKNSLKFLNNINWLEPQVLQNGIRQNSVSKQYVYSLGLIFSELCKSSITFEGDIPIKLAMAVFMQDLFSK
ncbi:MAG: hypothetical protein MHMPM18_001028 [Marteilia pararefringens]